MINRFSPVVTLLALLFIVNPVQAQKNAVEAFNNAQYDEAIKVWDELLKENPELKQAYYNQGNANFRLGKVDEAVQAYEKALSEKSPEGLADVYYNLGNAYLNKQDVDKAREFYKQALKLRPGDQDAKANLELLNQMPPPPPQEEESQQDQDDQEGEDQEQDQDSQSNNDQQKDEDQQDQEEQDSPQDQKEDQQPQDSQKDEQSQDDQDQQEPDPNKPDQEQLMNAQQLLDALKDRETENMREQIRLKTSGQDNEKDW